MSPRTKKTSPSSKPARAFVVPGYDSVLSDIVDLLNTARRASAHTVNAIMTAGSEIWPTLSAQSDSMNFSTLSRKSAPPAISYLRSVAARFLLSWSHYARLLSVANPLAREFYETEALRGGWTVRQLDRQIGSQFYERTALSRKKTAMLGNGGKSRPEDAMSPDEEIRDPLVLEFLGLKDEMLIREYQTALPSEELLAEEIRKARKRLESRLTGRGL